MKLAALAAVAGLALSGCNKMTGGGWLVDFDGDVVNFGFNAQPVGEPDGECSVGGPPCQAAKGRLNIVDHGNVSGVPVHVKATFSGTYTGQAPLGCATSATFPCSSEFVGEAVVDGFNYIFRMRVTDNGEGQIEDGVDGDYLEVFLTPTDGGPDIGPYLGTIGAGNIQVHKK